MAGKGLIIGIDYTDRYCQACYYSVRHQRPESVSAGSDVRRYLIPSVLCYDTEIREWLIGDSAMRISEKEGVLVFTDLMRNVRAGSAQIIEGREYSYIELLAIYFSRLLEFIQIMTSVMSVDCISFTMRNTSREMSDNIKMIFEAAGVPASKVKLLSSSESFGYFIINEKTELWQNGALLFDFSNDGFFVEQLNITNHGAIPMINICEYDFSSDFSVSNLASEVLRDQLDKKLTNLYYDLVSDGGNYSVFFTGEGFNEQWFNNTLNSISDTRRAFKGSNIYVKGACLEGKKRFESETDEIPMMCPGRTVCEISVEAVDNGMREEIMLSPAAVDWYDADYEGDFILEDEKSILIFTTSILTGVKSAVEINLDGFPERPSKASRIHISMKYRNEHDCVIRVTDKGFGEFFTNSGYETTVTVKTDSME